MEWYERQEMYLDYLLTEGYRPAVEDGHVHFTRDRGSYYLLKTDDPQFVQLLYPNFWPIESAVELDHCLRAAAHANRSTKIAKVMPYASLENMLVTAEILVGEPQQALGLMPRLMNTITTAVGYFQEEMRELGT